MAEYNEITNYLLTSKYPVSCRGDPGLKANFRRKVANFKVINTELIYLHKPSRTTDMAIQLKVIQNKPDQQRVLSLCHDGSDTSLQANSIGGHLGRDKTLGKIMERFWWPGIKGDFERHVNSCDRCQKASTRFDKAAPEMLSIAIKPCPWYQIGVDICSLKKTSSGFSCIIVAVDYFTKWVEAKAIKNKSALTVAMFLFECICRHGVPAIQINDQGREFVNRVSKELHRLTGTEHRLTSAYHPQSNGLVERNNRTIQNSLLKVLNQKSEDWPEALQGVLFALNTSRHQSTGYTPFFLLYGRQPSLPVDIHFQNSAPPPAVENLDEDTTNESDINRRVTEISKVRDGIFTNATNNIKRAQQRQRRNYRNRHKKKYSFKTGNVVLTWNHRRSSRKGGKEADPWTGPYEIVRSLKNGLYQLKNLISQNILKSKTHGSNMKLYKTPTQKAEPKKTLKKKDFILTHQDRISQLDVFNDGGVRVLHDPLGNGDCQFVAVSHQLSLRELFVTPERLRDVAVSHIQSNECYYTDFVPETVNIDAYCGKMKKRGTYGDHITLFAMCREFNIQCLLISPNGVGHCMMISPTEKPEKDLPVLTLGYFPEGNGEHYLSVAVNASTMQKIQLESVSFEEHVYEDDDSIRDEANNSDAYDQADQDAGDEGEEDEPFEANKDAGDEGEDDEPFEADQDEGDEGEEDEPFETDQDAGDQGEEDEPFEADQDAGDQGEEDEPFEADQDAGVEMEEDEPFEADQDAGDEGEEDEPFETDQDQGVEGEEDEPFEGDQDVGVEGEEDEPFETDQDAGDEGEEDEPFETDQDAGDEGEEDEPFEGDQDVGVEMEEDEPFEGDQDVGDEGEEDEPFEGDQDAGDKAEEDEPFETDQDVGDEGEEDEPLEGDQDAGVEGEEDVPLRPRNDVLDMESGESFEVEKDIDIEGEEALVADADDEVPEGVRVEATCNGLFEVEESVRVNSEDVGSVEAEGVEELDTEGHGDLNVEERVGDEGRIAAVIDKKENDEGSDGKADDVEGECASAFDGRKFTELPNELIVVIMKFSLVKPENFCQTFKALSLVSKRFNFLTTVAIKCHCKNGIKRCPHHIHLTAYTGPCFTTVRALGNNYGFGGGVIHAIKNLICNPRWIHAKVILKPLTEEEGIDWFAIVKFFWKRKSRGKRYYK